MENEKLRGNSDIMILSILSRGDSYGYEISKRIVRLSGGAYSMKETTLYSALSRLERLGLVSSYGGTETMGRVRTYLTLTERGREYFSEQCRQWNEAAQVMGCFIGDGNEGTGTVY